MRAFVFRLTPVCLAVSSVLTGLSMAEAEEEKTLVLSPVVVTATRQAQNSFDLPVAIDVVEQHNIRDGQLQMQLSESLIRVPGITAQNRNNQAQDPQISTRGFGSRSAFGVRGVRVYVDGIPLTMPDGQGQPGVVDLSAVKSIEVMRGPFSSLYGNSSGGVIQMLTQDAPQSPEVDGSIMFGSYGTKRQTLQASGQSENVEYMLNVSNFETDGYRDHNSGKKQQATAKFKFNISDDTKLTALVNWFDQEAQDPLGLNRAAAFSTPKAAGVGSIVSNTRVSRTHTQVGFNLQHAFNENNSISFIPYVGTRQNEQFLALPPAAPINANGRASEISRDFWGADLRWVNKGIVLSKPYNVSLGLTYGKMNDDRVDTNADNGIARNNNVVNNANFGLNRREENISRNFDQYIQGRLSLTDSFDIHAGARHTKVNLKIKDDFITGNSANGNNSGAVEYQKTTPVIGAVWKATDSINLYANFGKGFETPTFIESSFATSAANSTPNLGLKPSESNNYELGVKAYLNSTTRANMTLYHVSTDDEIIVQDNIAGRASYTNANKTKRRGVEFSIQSEFDNNISLYGAYTLLDAKFDSDFTNRLNTTIRSGNTIPGTYRSQLYGEVAWRYQPLGFFSALEGRYNSKVYVDDVNSDSAPSYTIFNLRAGFEQKLKNWRFKEYVRVENMFDKDYIGSVRINDGNLRFFEPATDRNYLVGLSAGYTF
jgi:iron complex outermembrane recepter protein